MPVLPPSPCSGAVVGAVLLLVAGEDTVAVVAIDCSVLTGPRLLGSVGVGLDGPVSGVLESGDGVSPFSVQATLSEASTDSRDRSRTRRLARFELGAAMARLQA